jgi:hypothetical protein
MTRTRRMKITILQKIAKKVRFLADSGRCCTQYKLYVVVKCCELENLRIVHLKAMGF